VVWFLYTYPKAKLCPQLLPAPRQAFTIGGSLIGGIVETQQVLDFCAEHQILLQVQMIDIQDINEAFEKINNEEVRFRYVIDMNSLK